MSRSFELDKLKLKQMRNAYFSGRRIKLQHKSLQIKYSIIVWMYSANKQTQRQTVLS